jgi:MraZ protein
MFLGTYEHAIDDKGRITIPAKYRSRYESGAVLTEGIERCLYLFPIDVWTDLAQRASALPLTNPTAREFQRQLFGGASDSVPDKQGRIILPSHLREYANIDNQAIIIGMYSRCEIWSSESLRERKEERASDSESRAADYAGLGI